MNQDMFSNFEMCTVPNAAHYATDSVHRYPRRATEAYRALVHSTTFSCLKDTWLTPRVLLLTIRSRVFKLPLGYKLWK
jgi:hypothetical protein